MKISAASLDPEATYKLMTGVVVPRPIAWITMLGDTGIVNLAPFSCFTFVSNKPPMVGINIGRKAGVRKDTGRNIHDRGEFVVNIGDEALIGTIHASAVEHAPEVSEVELLSLGTLPSDVIAVPRLREAPISLERRLERVVECGRTGAEFFVGEVLVFHVRDELYRDGKVETVLLRPVCRLGGPNYAKLGEIVRMQPIRQTTKTVIES
jgi:flavin reductase (DIM6/NTAB) family NADH-FMN oxidoreductase RutF